MSKMYTFSTPVHADDCCWKGRPVLIPYLLVNRSVFACLCAIVFFRLYQGVWSIFTLVLIGILLVSSLTGIQRWSKQTYYVTTYGLVVENGKKRYCRYWHELSSREVCILNNPLERLLNCRTVRFGKHKRNSMRNDPWREKTNFWCIKEYELVYKMIKAAMDKEKGNSFRK